MKALGDRREPHEPVDELAELFAEKRPTASPLAPIERRILSAIAPPALAPAEWIPGARLAAAAFACAIVFGVGLGAALPLAEEPDAVELAVLGTFSGDLGAELP